MWYCYIVRKTDNFKHLGLITKDEDLKQIYTFITAVTDMHPKDLFTFEITYNKGEN